MRNSNRELEEDGDKRLAIPITVRQLEAIVRISESRAKMELKPFATDAHVDEAIRIFQVILSEVTVEGKVLFCAGVHIIRSSVWRLVRSRGIHH